MSAYKDLLDMIEVITTTIEIHGREEEFFRRSARASSSEAAKALFSEIADDVSRYRLSLEIRRQKMWETISSLGMVGQKAY